MLSGRVGYLRGLKSLEAKQVKCILQPNIRLNHQSQDRGSEYGDLEEDIGLSSELYASHVPTSLVQKVLLGIGSSVVGLLDPRRGGKSMSPQITA